MVYNPYCALGMAITLLSTTIVLFIMLEVVIEEALNSGYAITLIKVADTCLDNTVKQHLLK
jgi:hypothetical protein